MPRAAGQRFGCFGSPDRGLEGLVLVLAAAYYVWGGRDTDGGAIIGHRADERQKNMQMKVTALQGQVMTVTAA
jgi:hypothetical protein